MTLFSICFFSCPLLVFAHEPTGTGDLSDVDARIEFHTKKIAESPRLYPAYAELGQALFDKARLTHDPRWLAQARAALQKSIDIQPNAEAFRALAALANYRHRFPEALEWCGKLREALPEDTHVLAMTIEAHLALGEIEKARVVIDQQNTNDFWINVARAYVARARGDGFSAVQHFLQAAELAKAQKVSRLEVWSMLQAASVLIDDAQSADPAPTAEEKTQRLAQVDEIVRRAAALFPQDTGVRFTTARLAEARGDFALASQLFQTLARETNDPEVHLRAHAAARRVGDMTASAAHFAAARRSFLLAIDAGEVFAFGALARLYLDAGERLDEALQLAQTNLLHQRDASAQATLHAAESAFAARTIKR